MLTNIMILKNNNQGDKAMDVNGNTGDGNTGDLNTGNRNKGILNVGDLNVGDFNTGNRNTGDRNTGSRNTGGFNAGSRNTGYNNTGDRNAGKENTGHSNTGHRNTGDINTGDGNTGNRNTGGGNTGNRNTGYCNTGYCNTGDWNTGDGNTGYCNTITPGEILVFNKPCTLKEWQKTRKPSWMYCELSKWVSEGDMSDKEKEAFPTYITTGGYLKSHPTMHHAFIESWENASAEDKELTFKLPNFDAKVFEEIFGFNPCKNMTVEMTVAEIAAKLGHDVKIVK